jgi:predicted transcriptional regulator
MTITLDNELEQQVSENAERLGVTPEEYIRRAVSWYSEPEPELALELAEWQAASRKAWAMVEESAP